MGTSFLKRCTRFKTKRFLLATGASFLFSAATVFALVGGGVDDPNGPFQLEGNATDDASVCFPLGSASCSNVAFGAASEDWDKIYNAVTNGGATAALAKSFVSDPVNGNDNILTQPGGGGGAKDTNDFGVWTWKSGPQIKPQAKDDIGNAFAAAYTLPNGHTGIYFGMDRFDNSGDATAGFWFVQDGSVGPVGDGSHGSNFSGHHTDGDLLIVSDFSTGGATSEIRVFKWSGGASGSLVAGVDLTSNATCDPRSGTSSFCAITNPNDGVSPPWTFTNKSGQTTFAHGELLEGGIDLESIFPNGVPCFTNFFAETRSSTSPTASLSDFTTPVSFPLCGVSLTKTCSGNGVVQSDGTSVKYHWTGTVHNDGIGSLFDVTVVDTLPDSTTANIKVICPTPGTPASCVASSLAPHSTQNWSVDFTATTGNVSDPLAVTNTAFAQGATSEGGPALIKSTPPASASCSTQVSGALLVQKACDATKGGPVLVTGETNGRVVVQVPFLAKICNTTAPGAGEAINNITLSDNPTATLSQSSISSLAPGACVSITGNYFPSAISSGDGTTAGRYFFSDTLTASGGKGALTGNTISSASDSVSCPICPSNECDGPLPNHITP